MSEQRTSTTVQVIETTTTVYDFPNYPEAKCPAHGDPLCTRCARNPSSCAGDDEMAGCGTYAASGMHWDTCPNRIR